MSREYIDTHAHLYDEVFSEDPDQVINRLIAVGISKVLMPNLDSQSIAPMLEFQSTHSPICEVMLGLHPCYIRKKFQQELYQMESLFTKHNFIAIGEVGIDLYRNKDYQAEQEEALEIQIDWAKQYNLPLVFHMRNAADVMLPLLRKHQDGRLRGVIHCFCGTLSEAQEIIDLGFALGIGGLVTFENSELSKVIASLSLQHLVLETDSPYLAPVPYRNKRNEPLYLPYIADAIATIHRVRVEDVATSTTDNAKRIFGLSIPTT